MYVAITGPKGYEQVEIKECYRKPGSKGNKYVTLQKLGRLSKLTEDDPDFIEKLKAKIAKERDEKKKSKTVTLTVQPQQINSVEDQRGCYHFGHMIVKRLWEMMRLDVFFDKHVENKNKEELLRAIYYLVSMRLGNPISIRSAHKKQKTQAGMTAVTLDVLYSVLDVFADQREELLKHISRFFSKHTDRNLNTVSYDVTNYYFESQAEGTLRLFGYSKEHKNNEVIVVMGLLIDSNGIPVTMRLFPGNTMDQNTLQDSIDELKKLYGFNEITVIADRGMNSKENLVFLADQHHHFLISYTLKKSSAAIRKQCLSGSWEVEKYDDDTGELIFASKVIDTTVEAKVPYTEEELKAIQEERRKENKRGRMPKYRVQEIKAKLHVTYSKSRADKDYADRQRAIEKAKKKLKNGSASQALRYGCNKYIDFDSELKANGINQERIDEESKWDGYYAVITDNMDLSTTEVSDLYKTQWMIEECFRILKTDLEARPVRVFTDKHIEGHFTLCYLALCMLRYIQYRLRTDHGIEMSAARIMDAVEEPVVGVNGSFPNMLLTPYCCSEDFLTLIDKLGFARIETEMTLYRFRTLTKLNLVSQVNGLI